MFNQNQAAMTPKSSEYSGSFLSDLTPNYKESILPLTEENFPQGEK
jgi:hypothetical protein